VHPFLVIGSCSSEDPSLLLLVIGSTKAILVIEGVSSGACQGLWEPEEVCTWLELHHAGMVNGDS